MNDSQISLGYTPVSTRQVKETSRAFQSNADLPVRRCRSIHFDRVIMVSCGIYLANDVISRNKVREGGGSKPVFQGGFLNQVLFLLGYHFVLGRSGRYWYLQIQETCLRFKETRPLALFT